MCVAKIFFKLYYRPKYSKKLSKVKIYTNMRNKFFLIGPTGRCDMQTFLDHIKQHGYVKNMFLHTNSDSDNYMMYTEYM